MMKSLERNHSWGTCAAVNAFVCPGAGTWMAGKKWSGAFQICLAIMGASLTILFLIAYALGCLEIGEILPPFTPKLMILGGGGVGLFLVSLAWSFFSIRCLRDKRVPPVIK